MCPEPGKIQQTVMLLHTNTHLPPAFAGALTPVRGPEAEAAGAAKRIQWIKVEGTFPTCITPDTSHISL